MTTTDLTATAVTATEITWLDPAQLDTRDVSGAVAVLEACRVADAPHLLPTTTSHFTTSVVHGWERDPQHTAVVRDDDGRVVGVLQVSLPMWDNRHLAQVEVYVHPAARRRGRGRLLFETGAAFARAHGRTTLLAESWDQPGAIAFAKAMGLDRAMDEVNRHQDLTRLDRRALATLEADAGAAAGDYELLRIAGDVPDELVDMVVELTHAINDAPIDDLDIEDEVFSAERLRAFEESIARYQRRPYRLVARHRETGAPAGHTVVVIDEQFPWHGYQFDTSVVRQHRGHRLGLLLKSAMLQWLSEQEPQLTVLSTWNAATNNHMIAVNETLGYRVVGNAIAWQIKR